MNSNPLFLGGIDLIGHAKKIHMLHSDCEQAWPHIVTSPITGGGT